MYSFLPHEYISELRREYLKRVLIVLISTITVVIVIGDCFLIPSLILARAEHASLDDKLAQITTATSSSILKTALKDVQKTNSLLAQAPLDQLSLVDSVTSVVGHRGEGVVLNQIALSYKDAQFFVSLNGRADTRDALVAFKKALELDPRITKVELPVSDLAKSKNISFALKVTGVFKKDSTNKHE